MSKVYLASGSPRRQALLRQLGIEFEVVVPAVAEQPLQREPAAEYVRRLAGEKARQVAALVTRRGLAHWPVLAADTIVVLDEEILGKPRDRRQGEQMLRRLSGREHRVLTAVTMMHAGVAHAALSMSRVQFRPLEPAEIGRYWETGEPADKAGAYALQGRGAAFVAHIDGSYSGIVGLPLFEVAQLLRRIELDVR